ncbi:MAG: hypothetical protein IJ088_11845, partial [Clostridia bacterium]|nr:hypothetical protein [Clostridia bacterium]
PAGMCIMPLMWGTGNSFFRSINPRGGAGEWTWEFPNVRTGIRYIHGSAYLLGFNDNCNRNAVVLSECWDDADVFPID